MKILTTPAGSVISGALVYMFLASLWIACRDAVGSSFSGHWPSVLNSSMVYLICIAAGIVSATMSKNHVLISGFCAAAIGEVMHGIIGLMQAFYRAGLGGMLNYPPSSLINLVLNAVPAGILGAAGGAVAVVIFKLSVK